MAQEEPTYEGRNHTSSRQPASPNTVVIPRANEIALLSDLEDNLEQTIEHIERFIKDKATLAETNEDCEALVQQKFEELRDLINAREQLQLDKLQARFNDRDDKLQKQIDMLEQHKRNNEDTKDECINLVATMTERDQKNERFDMIKKLIEDNINQSPNIQVVPIDLKFTFKTEKDTKKLIENYGDLHFHRIETGKALPYSRLGTQVITKPKTQGRPGGAGRNVGGSNSNNNNMNSNNIEANEDVKLPDLPDFKLFMKCDKNTGKVSCEAKQLKSELEKDDLIYLHVQCSVDNNKKIEDWDQAEIHVQQYLQVSQMAFDGKKYVSELEDMMNINIETDMIIHGRARFVYLEYEDATDSIRKVGNWTGENSAKYRYAGGNSISSPMSVGSDEKAQEEPPIQNEPLITIEDLPDKIKFKAKVIMGGDVKDGKSIILTKKKDEINYDGLINKLRSVPLIKKSSNPNADFNIVLTNCGNIEINDDDDFTKNCIARAVNVEKGDLADSLGMVATAIES